MHKLQLASYLLTNELKVPEGICECLQVGVFRDTICFRCGAQGTADRQVSMFKRQVKGLRVFVEALS